MISKFINHNIYILYTFTFIVSLFFNNSKANVIKQAVIECENIKNSTPSEEKKTSIPHTQITEKMIEVRKKEIMEKAINAGVSSQNASLANTLKFLPEVAIKEVTQPEYTLSFEEYFKRTMPQSKIDSAKKFLIENWNDLEKIEKKYKVDKEVIVALILVETNFGKVLGNYNIMDSLFTLSLTSYRPEFWTKELINVFILINQGNTLYERNTKGSWAGAVGLVQFIPSSFMKLAIDGNGDGKIDTVNNKMDAFASAANYLNVSGWKYKGKYLREVKISLSQREMCEKAGRPFDDGFLMLPDKKLESKRFIVYNNFSTVLLWNRSLFFSTTVGIVFNELKDVSKDYKK